MVGAQGQPASAALQVSAKLTGKAPGRRGTGGTSGKHGRPSPTAALPPRAPQSGGGIRGPEPTPSPHGARGTPSRCQPPAVFAHPLPQQGGAEAHLLLPQGLQLGGPVVVNDEAQVRVHGHGHQEAALQHPLPAGTWPCRLHRPPPPPPPAPGPEKCRRLAWGSGLWFPDLSLALSLPAESCRLATAGTTSCCSPRCPRRITAG